MSEDKPPPPKRSMTFRLIARSDKDLVAGMAAVVAAVPRGVKFEICEAAPAPEPAPPTVKDEPLETKAHELLIKLADQDAAEKDKKAAAAELDAERKRAEIVAHRKGFLTFLALQFERGVRITIDLYEKVVGLVDSGVEKLTGVLGGKKEGE